MLNEYRILVRFSGDKNYFIFAESPEQAQDYALMKFRDENDLHPYVEEVHPILNINHMKGF